MPLPDRYAVLGHPGYKFFVRLCAHPDGRVEAWTIGKEDTLGENPPTGARVIPLQVAGAFHTPRAVSVAASPVASHG